MKPLLLVVSLLCTLLLAGCCNQGQTIRDDVVILPVTPVVIDSLPAQHPIPAWIAALEWNRMVDSLLAELEKAHNVKPETVKTTNWRDRPLTVRDYLAHHITPSADTTDVMFHLTREPYFSFQSKHGPLRYTDRDTTHTTIVQEFSLWAKIGYAGLFLFVGAAICAIVILVLKR